jgi:hypothetical protein
VGHLELLILFSRAEIIGDQCHVVDNGRLWLKLWIIRLWDPILVERVDGLNGLYPLIDATDYMRSLSSSLAMDYL